ncbi:DUF1937 family protein [Maridesulfovibrio frigidus]|uniref:DUF1937 family protein n=1 Tax=Maridesulfovibrio frigidus TaxID=340956 RepID=UPI00068C06EC|nr:DUF1937 family protein [Maridesulfovibrio frigidus]
MSYIPSKLHSDQKKTPLKIYLACPYTHPDPEVRTNRYEAVNIAAARLITAGYIVYSPISHSHGITNTGLPMDWTFWKRIDQEFIRWADQLWILKLEGWEESHGIGAELEFAASEFKVVRFVSPEHYNVSSF